MNIRLQAAAIIFNDTRKNIISLIALGSNYADRRGQCRGGKKTKTLKLIQFDVTRPHVVI